MGECGSRTSRPGRWNHDLIRYTTTVRFLAVPNLVVRLLRWRSCYSARWSGPPESTFVEDKSRRDYITLKSGKRSVRKRWIEDKKVLGIFAFEELAGATSTASGGDGLQ